MRGFPPLRNEPLFFSTFFCCFRKQCLLRFKFLLTDGNWKFNICHQKWKADIWHPFSSRHSACPLLRLCRQFDGQTDGARGDVFAFTWGTECEEGKFGLFASVSRFSSSSFLLPSRRLVLNGTINISPSTHSSPSAIRLRTPGDLRDFSAKHVFLNYFYHFVVFLHHCRPQSSGRTNRNFWPIL